jgi:hypothetical protein
MSLNFSSLSTLFFQVVQSRYGNHDTIEQWLDDLDKKLAFLKSALEDSNDFPLLCVLMEGMRESNIYWYTQWMARLDLLGAWLDVSKEQKSKIKTELIAFLHQQANSQRVSSGLHPVLFDHSSLAVADISSRFASLSLSTHSLTPLSPSLSGTSVAQISTGNSTASVMPKAAAKDASSAALVVRNKKNDNDKNLGGKNGNKTSHSHMGTRRNKTENTPCKWDEPVCPKCLPSDTGKKHSVSQCWVDFPERAPNHLKAIFQKHHDARRAREQEGSLI